jgi:trehalose 6-phosphate phosphatase
MALPAALQPLAADAPTAGFFLDFDGSLAPIVDDPAAARPHPAARAALARLVPLIGRSAVVSGRPVGFLVSALGIDGLDYVGAYGLERIVGGAVVVDSRVEPWVDVIARAGDDAESALPGLLVERKGRVAVTLHWRTDPSRGPEAIAWAEAAAERLGLDVPLHGRMAVELRPPVAVDKGTTVAELASGTTVAGFAGDDAGDVPAFAALRRLATDGALRHAVTIGVASREAPPAVLDADVLVDGPQGLADLLDDLADAISARA